jgi:hypothetical protein
MKLIETKLDIIKIIAVIIVCISMIGIHVCDIFLKSEYIDFGIFGVLIGLLLFVICKFLEYIRRNKNIKK